MRLTDASLKLGELDVLVAVLEQVSGHEPSEIAEELALDTARALGPGARAFHFSLPVEVGKKTTVSLR